MYASVAVYNIKDHYGRDRMVIEFTYDNQILTTLNWWF